jgi:hypothetical protein
MSQEGPVAEDRYRVRLLSEAGQSIDTDAVVELWTREGALPTEEARRRASEVLSVATDEEGVVVGVSTVYVARQPQLRMDLWQYRTFIAQDHRMSLLARRLLLHSQAHLEERFERGEDTRAGGMFFVLQNRGMQAKRTEAVWKLNHFAFVGEGRRGAHHRVYFFPSARVPGPPR